MSRGEWPRATPVPHATDLSVAALVAALLRREQPDLDPATAERLTQALFDSRLVDGSLVDRHLRDLPVYATTEPEPGDLVRVTRHTLDPRGALTDCRSITGYWEHDETSLAEKEQDGSQPGLDAGDGGPTTAPSWWLTSWASGTCWVHGTDPDLGARIRTEGPFTFGTARGHYTEYDWIEILEARHGAPFRDILDASHDEHLQAERARHRDQERRDRQNRREDRRAARRRLLGRLVGRRDAAASDRATARSREAQDRS